MLLITAISIDSINSKKKKISQCNNNISPEGGSKLNSQNMCTKIYLTLDSV
jgi:hypothetical protein